MRAKILTVVKWLALGLTSLVLLLAVFIAVFDWNLAKGYLAAKASAALGRDLTIDGNLDVDLGWGWPRIHAEGVRLANASWGEAPAMLTLEAVTVRVSLWSLLVGRVVLPELRLEQPRVWLEVSPEGQGNWVFSNPPPATEPSEPITIPLIQQLQIRDGQAHYRDPIQNTAVSATLSTLPGAAGEAAVQVGAAGLLQGRDLRLGLVGGSLLQLGAAGQAYPLMLQLDLGGPENRFKNSLQLQAYLLQQGDAWRLQDMQLTAGDSDLAGQIAIEPGGRRLGVKADLSSRLLNIDQLTRLFAGSAEPARENDQENAADIGVLNAFNAAVTLRADRLLVAGMPLDAVALDATVQDGLLTVNPLSTALGGGGAQIETRLDATAQPPTGTARLVLRQVDLARTLQQLELGGATTGVLDGEIKLSLATLPAGQANPLTLPALLQRLQPEPSELHYRDASTDTTLTTTVKPDPRADGSTPGVSVTVAGTSSTQPMRLEFKGEPLVGLTRLNTDPYGLRGQLSINGVTGRAQGRLDRQGSRWRLQDVVGELGDSDLRGVVAIDTSGKRPLLLGDLSSNRLALEQLVGAEPADNGKNGKNSTGKNAARRNEAPANAAPPARRQTAEQRQQAIQDGVAPLRLVDADIALRAKRVTIPGLDMRPASMDLKLREGRLTLEPLQLDSASGGLTATVAFDAGKRPVTVTIDALLRQVNLATLLAPYGVKDPRLAVVDGRLRFSAAGGDEPTRVEAEGRYRNEPFKLRFTGDPLPTLAQPDQPYGVDLTLNIVKSELRAQGKLPRPVDSQPLNLKLALKGPDPSLLSPLINFPLPKLPPYDLAGQLARRGDVLNLTGFTGRVGDSDLAGDVRVNLSGPRPHIDGDLRSRKLDFDDLGPLIGAAPNPNETASPEQKQEAAARQASPFVLPRQPLHLQRLAQVMEGTIHYQGEHIDAPKLPLDDLNAVMVVEQGRVTFKPLEFGVGGGRMRSDISFDVSGAAPRGEVESEIRRVDLRRVLAPFPVGKDSFGIISGRVKLWVDGDSIGDFFGSADGGLYLLMTGGRLDSLLVELAGLDAGEALAVWFTDPKSSVPIRCAYADLHSRDGRMSLDTVVIDTTDTLFVAGGSIDFKQEQLDVAIQPKPKDFSVLSATSSLHIRGRLKKPSVLPGTEAIVRGAAAAVLAVIATPVAALLPLIEPGDNEDSPYCSGLVNSADKAQRQSSAGKPGR